MKIIVTGSLGNTGRPLVEKLVKAGHTVTGIIRNADRQVELEKLGATAAIGSLTDVEFLKTAFAGADAVFCMIPSDYSATDAVRHYRNVAESYAKAIQHSGVKKIVHLSSWGADLDRGTGYILGSHHAENILNTIPDVSITHLRAGFLYYNLFGFVDMIKHTGSIASNYGGNDKIVMAAPFDIAMAASEELIDTSTGMNVRYIASDDRTANDIAHVLGKAIGQLDLQWKTLSIEEMKKNLEQNGVPQYAIENIAALNESIHNGNMRKDYDRTGATPTGKIKLEDFAREFAAVYNKS